MTLQDIFDSLTYGEFSQLRIGGAEVGVIDDTNYDRVLSHVNLGLTTLYTRFNLKEVRTVFPLDAAVSTYVVTAADLLKIERVLTDADFELNLNVQSDMYSCFTPSLSMVRVPQVILDQGPSLPDDYKTESFTMVYRANHPQIKTKFGLIFPEKVVLELPPTHVQPLLYFVASRVQAPIGMANEFNASNNYYAKYEAACQALEGKGIQVDQGDQNTKLCRAGWV